MGKLAEGVVFFAAGTAVYTGLDWLRDEYDSTSQTPPPIAQDGLSAAAAFAKETGKMLIDNRPVEGPDANGDGCFNIYDRVLISSGVGAPSMPSDWDMDGDGELTENDLDVLAELNDTCARQETISAPAPTETSAQTYQDLTDAELEGVAFTDYYIAPYNPPGTDRKERQVYLNLAHWVFRLKDNNHNSLDETEDFLNSGNGIITAKVVIENGKEFSMADADVAGEGVKTGAFGSGNGYYFDSNRMLAGEGICGAASIVDTLLREAALYPVSVPYANYQYPPFSRPNEQSVVIDMRVGVDMVFKNNTGADYLMIIVFDNAKGTLQIGGKFLK